MWGNNMYSLYRTHQRRSRHDAQCHEHDYYDNRDNDFLIHDLLLISDTLLIIS
jgi:hypothetical protein